MLYTTVAEIKKRYEFLVEDSVSDDRIEVAIYDASTEINAVLAGSISKLPFSTEAELALYPIISRLCVLKTVCSIILDTRARGLYTKTENFTVLQDCCGAASDLVKQIQNGVASIGLEDEDMDDETSRGEYLANTGTDAFGSRS